MLRQSFAGALICFALPSVAQNFVEHPDSAANTVELHAVEISAPTHIVRADRNIILPPRSAVMASVNTRDLISRLNIPRISVNPLTGEIGMTGNGTVIITVDGVIRTPSELAAVQPTDIVKIEHTDNPGERYPDADVLINIVTRRPASGGSVAIDFLNAFKKGGEANLDNLSLTYAHGKSQWTYSGQLMRLRRDNWTRDHSESRVYPDATVDITEIGEPSEMETVNLENYLSCNISESDSYMLNARLGLVFNNTPHSEEADRTTIRTTSASDIATEIYEHMGERFLSPSLDLYGRFRLPDGSNIVGNIAGTYIHSHNDHIYRQTSAADLTAEEITSSARGRKYSIRSEIAYNIQSGIHRISAGVRHLQAYTDNEYSGDITSEVTIRQAQTNAYAQYSVTLGRLSLMTSLGASLFQNSQDGDRQMRWMLTPSAAISLNPSRNLSLRYRASLKGKMPSLSELSDIDQQIEPGYLRRGNPRLRAFRVIDTELSAGWDWQWLGVNISLPVNHEFKPVMESVVWDDGSFVRIYFNQRSFTHIAAEATMTLSPWKRLLSLSITPTVDHYRTRGDGFTCSHTIRNLRIDAEINWRRWQFSYNTLTGYANYMYGTRLMRERNMSMITAGYKTDRFTVKIGVLDPFIKRYWMETRDMAPLLSSISRAYSNSPAYFVAHVSLNLDFGRPATPNEIDLDNSDTDSGLLRGIK